MNTIRVRTLAAMMVAGVLPLIIMFMVMHFVVLNAIHQSEREKIEEISDKLARNVAAIMEGASNDLRSLATNPILADPSSSHEARLTEMQRLVAAYDSFSDISLYDAEGYLIDSTTKEEPVWREYSEWFQTAIGGETAISDPIASIDEESPLRLRVYLPIFGQSEPVSNVVVARLSFQRVLSLLSGVRYGKEGRAVLLNSFGRLICHPKQDEALLERFKRQFEHRFWEGESTGHYVDASGCEFLYHVATIQPSQTRVGSEWHILSMKPMEEVNSLLHQTVAISVLSFVVAVVVAFLLSALYSGKISSSLVSANEAARQVSNGNLDARMQEEGPVEMRSLASAFNVMVKELSDHREKMEHLVFLRTTSLQDSQEKLANTMAQLQAAFDSSQEAILLIDKSGQVVATNGMFCEIFGVEESQLESAQVSTLQEPLEKGCNDLEEFRNTWTRAVAEESATLDLEYEIETPNQRCLSLYSAPVRADGGEISGRLWTWRDLTAQRTLEQSLRQSQKMEAIGQLAGGVAHDFNNLLTGIIGNLAFAEMELDGSKSEPALRRIQMAMKAGNRAAELIKQLLDFSRRSHLKLSAAQANEVITDVRDLLLASIDPKVKISTNLRKDAWPVLIDPNQIEQVVMNLCVNAADALGEEGGTIKISSRNVTVALGEEGMPIDSNPGDYLRITVEDNGAGMTPEVQAKIFEPFFTTKEQGKGTGLGLATSFGIAKQLGGWIVCKSELGEGSRFELFLPRHDGVLEEKSDKKPTSLSISSSDVAPKAASATVLLVDDEKVVRKIAETLLSNLGYEIIVAGDGEEALRIYEERGSEIDMVVLDLTMPVLSGKDTFRRLRQEYDYVPVLICSGYLVDLTAFEKETGARPDGFVQKPYTLETMAETVKDMLEQARDAA